MLIDSNGVSLGRTVGIATDKALKSRPKGLLLLRKPITLKGCPIYKCKQ